MAFAAGRGFSRGLRRDARMLSLYIDGAACEASDGLTIAVRSPRDDAVIGRLADASAADAERAVGAAQRVKEAGAWARDDGLRVGVLRRGAAALREDVEGYAELESLDCGKVLAEARGDVGYCADVLDYYADLVEAPGFRGAEAPVAGPPEGYFDAKLSAKVAAGPVGVVALVTPWNFPLMQAVLKVAPAVAAGCPLVLKPSPLASLTCAKFFAEVLGPAAPAGAVNVVTGGPPASPVERASLALTTDPRVDFASFTGSGAGGKSVLAASAAALRPTGLELGGKGALVVVEDADLDAAADFAALGILQCAGQVCSATSRLLVHRSVERDLVARVVEKVEAVAIGDPLDPASTMGPVVSAAQRAKIEAAVQGALDDGATLANARADVSGLGSGYFVAPAVLRDAAPDSKAWREEIFGPVLCYAASQPASGSPRPPIHRRTTGFFFRPSTTTPTPSRSPTRRPTASATRSSPPTRRGATPSPTTSTRASSGSTTTSSSGRARPSAAPSGAASAGRAARPASGSTSRRRPSSPRPAASTWAATEARCVRLAHRPMWSLFSAQQGERRAPPPPPRIPAAARGVHVGGNFAAREVHE